MRDEAGLSAEEKWERAHAFLGDLPPSTPWSEFRTHESINEARQLYNEQPRVAALSAYDEKHPETPLVGFMGDPEQYDVTQEEYVQEARDAAVCPFAYVLHGEWHEPGRMGWWGVSSETPENRRHFRRQFNELLDSLPDDTLMTLVDCHI
jgi:hypothetical protein